MSFNVNRKYVTGRNFPPAQLSAVLLLVLLIVLLILLILTVVLLVLLIVLLVLLIVLTVVLIGHFYSSCEAVNLRIVSLLFGNFCRRVILCGDLKNMQSARKFLFPDKSVFT